MASGNSKDVPPGGPPKNDDDFPELDEIFPPGDWMGDQTGQQPKVPEQATPDAWTIEEQQAYAEQREMQAQYGADLPTALGSDPVPEEISVEVGESEDMESVMEGSFADDVVDEADVLLALPANPEEILDEPTPGPNPPPPEILMEAEPPDPPEALIIAAKPVIDDDPFAEPEKPQQAPRRRFERPRSLQMASSSLPPPAAAPPPAETPRSEPSPAAEAGRMTRRARSPSAAPPPAEAKTPVAVTPPPAEVKTPVAVTPPVELKTPVAVSPILELATPIAVPPPRPMATPTSVVPPRAEPEPAPAPKPTPTAQVSPPPPAAPRPRVEVVPGDGTFLDDHDAFRRDVQRLVRQHAWQELAAITSAAAESARWAALPEMKANLLADLARIYRDRLTDPSSTEDTYRRLTEVDPAHEEAVSFLSERYRERGDWRALYDLRGAAVDATWDPKLRLDWTRESVSIAQDRLRSTDLEIDAWERLYRLGEAEEETSRALTLVYRRARRWERLAEFLVKRSERLDATERLVHLREVVEAFLAGLRDADRAALVIEEIRNTRQDDAFALMALARVHARRKDWEAMAELGRYKQAVPEVLVDLRRIAADALWHAGELDRAVAVHEGILTVVPDDEDSLKAKEEYLVASKKLGELVAFLVERVEREKDEEKQVTLLARAATISHRDLGRVDEGIRLWERAAVHEDGRADALQALAELYETAGEPAGLARSLEGKLALTHDVPTRIELLRRLGGLYAHRLNDDERAESCWKQILSFVPDDKKCFEELVTLHRRRGDFDGLDRTLDRQAWRGLDDMSLLALWGTAAKNVEENFTDAGRAVRAWLRVLDFAPADPLALEAVVRHKKAQGVAREVVTAREDLLRVIDPARRTEQALEIARLWAAEGDRAGAIAAYERVLCWDPTDGTALDALVKLRAGDEAGAASSALDAASAHLAARGDEARRVDLARRALALVDPNDALGRFLALRRLLWLSGSDLSSVNELAKAAEAAKTWNELSAVYLDLAASAIDPAVRATYHRELAKIYHDRLKDPVRAVLILEAMGQQPLQDPHDAALCEKLFEETDRTEEHLAFLDVSTRQEASFDARRTALKKRAEITEARLNDKARAFHEWARLLALSPRDTHALNEVRRLAVEADLWRQLDALYAELADRAGTVEERLDLVRARQWVRAEKLDDPTGALDQLLIAYRLQPKPELEKEILAAADELKAWDRVYPLVEARLRAQGLDAPPDQLAAHAERHEKKRKDLGRALDLAVEAFVLRPESSQLEDRVEALASATNRPDRLASALRLAAARSQDPMRMLEVYPKLAEVYADRLNLRHEALDIHRRILQLRPSSLDSLEVVIDHQRKDKMWRELGDSLARWVDATAGKDHPARIERMLEIARLHREELGDPGRALGTYAEILDQVPEHAEALAGVRALTEGPRDPTLELRRLRIELGRTQGPRRAELLLECARVQTEQQNDPEGAVATLRELVAEAGASGPGYEPLSAALKKKKAWAEVVDLMEQRAIELDTAETRAIALEHTMAEAEAHAGVATDERMERLARRLLVERPQDLEARRRLLAVYRGNARHAELAELLRATLGSMPADDVERRPLQDELVRVLIVDGHVAEARSLLESRAKMDAGDAETLIALASLELGQGNMDAYLHLREKHARLLPREQASLVMCHLAEVCASLGNKPIKVPDYYRQAKTLDPQNPLPAEALKATGRRAKSWKAAAALLPDEDEASLTPSEKAARLTGRGDTVRPDDAQAALAWYRRAVAVDPDHYPAWEGLARVQHDHGDIEAALTAQQAALHAYERSTSPTADLMARAVRIQLLAEALEEAHDHERALILSARAHDLAPGLPPAALAVAEGHIEKGAHPQAMAIYGRLLREGAEPLTEQQRLLAHFRRGALAAKLQKTLDAIADLRAALRIDHLHPGALKALADLFTAQGRVGAAVQHYVQALLVEDDVEQRVRLYARLGRLWDDRLDSPEDASVYYDLALGAGADDRELMQRALKLYCRRGRTERALQVIEQLLPGATEAPELSSLWALKGDVTAPRDEEKAMEAYDMALSYSPGNELALRGLTQILERRGEWEQIFELYEARAETGMPQARAVAYRHLAKMAREHLKDETRAERYLRSAIELAPAREDWEALLVQTANAPERFEERRAATAGILSCHGPWMPYVVDLGQRLLARGERRNAWSLLSPLLTTSVLDQTIKPLVADLRKEFDKSDNVDALDPSMHVWARHPNVDATLFEVVVDLDLTVPLGPRKIDELELKQVVSADARSGAGKTFANIANLLGLEGATLSRTELLPRPIVILDGDRPEVILKNELVQLIATSETSFLYTMALEMARPGARVFSSLPVEERGRVVPALLAAIDVRSAESPAIEAMAEKIRAGVDPQQLAAWRERLEGAIWLDEPGYGARFADALLETTRRVGLVAATDVRGVARLLGRIDDTLPRLQSMGRLEELEHYLGASPPVRSLLAFAASATYGRLVAPPA